MKTNFDTNNNTNFGALFFHKGFRIGKTYKCNYEAAELSRKSLEVLAENYDIHIKFRNILEKGLDITVSKVVKSPLKRFLGIIGKKAERCVRPEFCRENGIVDTLLYNVNGAIEDFNQGEMKQ